jgi:SAM-dependent methyltransferase
VSGAPPYPPWVAYEPQLVPPPELMALEGIDVLEEWFRWGEEWSVLLRAFAGLGRASAVLEIGCGLGRVAFPLRYVLDETGSYDGFEIVKRKVDFLESTFTRAHPNFRFVWANVRNTHYNPEGEAEAAEYRFPYADKSFDVVFAASVFTHMAPVNAAQYLAESARVLRPGGHCLFSFFLLDNYRPASQRPGAFARTDFDFGREHGEADGFATAFPDDPERMTAYRLSLVKRLAREAGLRLARKPLPGYWSGAAANWVGAQDLVVLERRGFGRTLLASRRRRSESRMF